MHLVAVELAWMAELVVDDGNDACINYDAVGAQHARQAVLVCAGYAALVLYGCVLLAEPGCHKRILESLPDAKDDAIPFLALADDSFFAGLGEHFVYLADIAHAAEYFVHPLAYIALRRPRPSL